MSIFYKICLASAKFFSLGTGLAFASNAFNSSSFSNLFSLQTSELSQSTMEQIEKILRKVMQEEKVNVFTDLAKFYVQGSVGVISASIECIQTHPTFFMGIGLASSLVYYVKHTYESLFKDTVKTFSTPITKCFDFFSPYWSKVKSYLSSSSSSDKAGVAENIRDGFHEVNSNLHGILTNDVLARSDVASILTSLSGEVLDKLSETNKNLIKSEDLFHSLVKEQESQKVYLVESLDKTFTIIHDNNEMLNNHLKESMDSLDKAFRKVEEKLAMVEHEQQSLKNHISYQSYQLENNGSLPASDHPMSDPSFAEDLRTVFGDSVLDDRLFKTITGFPTIPSSPDSANSVLEVFDWFCFVESLSPLLYLFIFYTFFRSVCIYYIKK